jgi:DNA-binding IclR family transcriptional regulator
MAGSGLDALNEKPGRSVANRSLERGIEILRAFRVGSESLGNGDIADRTGLPPSTVSRLAQTLVGTGLLQPTSHRAYRLGPAVLSLAHAMRSGSTVMALAVPKMRALAERERINVGLAAADRDEMVYLESIRLGRRGVRTVVSGQRIPMELTSLGRAYLATVTDTRRRALYAVFRRRRSSQWRNIVDEIENAIRDVRTRGFCAASWQAEVVAVAAPLRTPDAVYVLNVSTSTRESIEVAARRLSGPLLALLEEVEASVEAKVSEAGW